MTAHIVDPVVCFSYIAAAEIWQVDSFPLANRGTEVLGVERSIVADGPMTAAVLSAFGVPTLLLTNDVGRDSDGTEVEQWLRRYGVSTTMRMKPGFRTPHNVDVADSHGTRTWFAHISGVADALAVLDLAPMAGASFAYIDCYQLIEAPAIRAIDAALSADVPLLINIGGSPLSEAMASSVRGHRRIAIQTNIDDADHRRGPEIAQSIRVAADTDWVVVTMGACGAVAAGRSQLLSVRAFRATVRNTHCAGSAFSGGLLYGLLNDWSMTESLELGCASGALRCERAQSEPLPTLAEMQTFIGSRESIGLPTT